jgi:shikimate kinase
VNIVLIGMRGAGKTVVGKILAGRLERTFIDMDSLIEQRAGMSISDIVEKYGWERFRDMEAAVAVEVSGMENIVNAAGGGVVTRPHNVQTLKNGGIIIWLDAGVETLASRIREDSGRPRLRDDLSWTAEIEAILEERGPLYYAAAELGVDTEGCSPDEVVEMIMNWLETRGGIDD